MRKIFFAIICSFIALGWVGCDSTTGGGVHEVYEVYIDSTLTACGMDSFLIKSPWMQEHINTFIETNANIRCASITLSIEYFKDKDGNDFFIEGSYKACSPGRLCDCEGNFLEEKDCWELFLEERGVKKGYTAVLIHIASYCNE
jgi:hypothetical protein